MNLPRKHCDDCGPHGCKCEYAEWDADTGERLVCEVRTEGTLPQGPECDLHYDGRKARAELEAARFRIQSLEAGLRQDSVVRLRDDDYLQRIRKQRDENLEKLEALRAEFESLRADLRALAGGSFKSGIPPTFERGKKP